MSSFWLEYTQNGEQREFSFDSPTVSIGRDKSADFVLDHPTVSRQHALIVSNQRGHQLVVLSRGGLTAIDGGQVSGEVDLFDGSQIHFGQLSFVFRSHNAPARPANAGSSWQGQAHSSGSWQAQSGAQSGGQSGGPSGGSFQHAGASGSFQSRNSGAFPSQAGASGSFQSHGQGAGLASQSSTGWEPAGAGLSSQSSTGWDTAGSSWETGTDGWSEVGDEPSDGIMSWDQIAASAEAQEAHEADGATDFERIQAAQAKAERQSKGTNPVLVIVGVVGIAVLLAFTFWPDQKKKVDPNKPNLEDEKVFIEWQSKDIDCVGEANCRNEAVAAYKVGQTTWERKDSDIVNRYVAYKQFDKSEKLLEEGGVVKLPPTMGDVQEKKKEVKKELDAIFRQYRINYREHKKRKMYDKMADTLKKIQAYFPDKRCQYYQWAVEKERAMKDAGVYPNEIAL